MLLRVNYALLALSALLCHVPFSLDARSVALASRDIYTERAKAHTDGGTRAWIIDRPPACMQPSGTDIIQAS